MHDVRRIGLEIKQNYSKIDVLIHNAGLHGFEQRVTSEGFAEMIAVNYLNALATNKSVKGLFGKSKKCKN